MKSLEGRLVKIKDQFRFVLSVDFLQRSVAVEVDAETVEPSRAGSAISYGG